MTNAMTAAEFLALRNKRMLEKPFQEEHVVPAFKRNGFEHVYHTWNSQHSPAGFPDVLGIRGRELHVVELKREGLQATPEQESWLDAFRRVELVVVHGVWHPSDIERLEELLR